MKVLKLSSPVPCPECHETCRTVTIYGNCRNCGATVLSKRALDSSASPAPQHRTSTY